MSFGKISLIEQKLLTHRKVSQCCLIRKTIAARSALPLKEPDIRAAAKVSMTWVPMGAQHQETGSMC